jgi:hypothetical protein
MHAIITLFLRRGHLAKMATVIKQHLEATEGLLETVPAQDHHQLAAGVPIVRCRGKSFGYTDGIGELAN